MIDLSEKPFAKMQLLQLRRCLKFWQVKFKYNDCSRFMLEYILKTIYGKASRNHAHCAANRYILRTRTRTLLFSHHVVYFISLLSSIALPCQRNSSKYIFLKSAASGKRQLRKVSPPSGPCRASMPRY